MFFSALLRLTALNSDVWKDKDGVVLLMHLDLERVYDTYPSKNRAQYDDYRAT
jgi:hypothetical protein